jgi:hypothetical protein
MEELFRGTWTPPRALLGCEAPWFPASVAKTVSDTIQARLCPVA